MSLTLRSHALPFSSFWKALKLSSFLERNSMSFSVSSLQAQSAKGATPDRLLILPHPAAKRHVDGANRTDVARDELRLR